MHRTPDHATRHETSPGPGTTVTDTARGAGRHRALGSLVVRCFRAAQANQLTDRAAALTFYGVLALIPAMICVVALVGLFGQYPSTVNTMITIAGQVGAKSQAETLKGPITDVVQAKGGAGALLGFGILATVWSASGYVSAFSRATNAIYDIREGRPFWWLRPLQVLLTVGLVIALAVVTMALVLTGSLAHAVGDAIGVGSTAVTVWDIAKWPFIVVAVMVLFSVLEWAAPNVRQPKFRGLSPGGVVGVVIWVLLSAIFGAYLANFGAFNATYGSLGGVIGFLVWLWLSNLALLVGVVLNAELERARELEDGEPAGQALQAAPRAAPPAETE